MKAQAIKDLQYSKYLKILLNCTCLKVCAFWKITNLTHCVNPYYVNLLAFIQLPILINSYLKKHKFWLFKSWLKPVRNIINALQTLSGVIKSIIRSSLYYT